MSAMSDSLWGQVIDVMYRTRMPVIHVSMFIKKQFTNEDLITTGGALAQLVFGKAAKIQAEFTELLCRLNG